MIMNNNGLPIFEKRLKMVVADSNLYLYEFAKEIGITYEALRKYLKGTRVPTIVTLKKICETFDISADWLLGLYE